MTGASLLKSRSFFEESFNSLTGVPSVAVAISGGSDSMALLRLVLDWASQLSVPPVVYALTVEHGLRSSSALEAQRVRTWCEGLGVAHHILPWPGAKPQTGIQAKARVARYDLLADWCKAHDVPIIVTGHTANDQAETVAMRKLRSHTAASLAAIWPEMKWKQVRVLRPLLDVTRRDLRAYLQSVGQEWIDDPSNEDQRFERVRIRLALKSEDVPLLVADASQARLQVLHDRSQVLAWVTNHGRIDDFGCVWLPRQPFQAAEAALRQEIMRHGIFTAGDGEPLSTLSLVDISAWSLKHMTGRRTLGGALVMLRRDHILVTREAGRITGVWQDMAKSGEMLWDGRFMVKAPSGSQVGPARLGKGMVAERGPKNLPFAVFFALPLVKLSDGRKILLPVAAELGVSATFCERLLA